MYTITTSIGDRTITVSAPSGREVLSLFAAVNPPVGTITASSCETLNMRDVLKDLHDLQPVALAPGF